MPTFLDKKEQVSDFKLTPYGIQRLSVGKLNPQYYAFFDDGILYDGKYAGVSEDQNDIHGRIKEETQYIDGIIRFEEIENSTPPSSLDPVDLTETLVESVAPSDMDVSPAQKMLNVNKYSFGNAIGSAKFEGKNKQTSPAWKIVTCQGEIESSTALDEATYNFTSASADLEAREFRIPQINVKLRYTKMATHPTNYGDKDDYGSLISETQPFSDGNVIKLLRNDLVIYAEEQNTQLLSENFDIEVFEMVSSSVGDAEISTTTLDRKFFEKEVEQIVDGIMKSPKPIKNYNTKLNQTAVEYYFDVLTDEEIHAKIACQCASSFNKSSFYVDIDYDCDMIEEEEIYYDIYGSATVPEICEPYVMDSDMQCEDDE